MPASDSANPSNNTLPGASFPVASVVVKQDTDEPTNLRSSNTGVIRTALASEVSALTSTGGRMVRSSTVENTTAESIPAPSPVVVTCSPAGTMTGTSCTAESQNVTRAL